MRQLIKEYLKELGVECVVKRAEKLEGGEEGVVEILGTGSS